MNPNYPTLPRKLSGLLVPVLVVASANLALAHPGHGIHSSFLPGVAHPLSGLDHLITMLAVGWVAVELRAPRLLPAAFLVMMAAGGALGHWAGPLAGVDQSIAASILVLGLLLTGALRLSAPFAAVLVGFFAIFHGWAHGAEMPLTANGLAYGAGFLSATACLLGAGVLIGTWADRRSLKLAPYAGWAVAAAGIAIAAF